MNLKFDDETIAIMLHKARLRIALRKTIYNCRRQIDSSLSYEEWKKKHIKKVGDANGQNTTDTDML